MNILIIEDEKRTAKGLEKMLRTLKPDFNILAILESVEDSVQWFSEKHGEELIFMDIQLADGICFEIFENIEINTPVIFTTSYSDYAIKAFEVNSIDYLKKPIQIKDLERSLAKYDRINRKETGNGNIEQLIEQIKNTQKQFKRRFLAKSINSYVSVPVEDIAYFFTENQLVFLFTKDNKRFMVNPKLENIENMLNPDDFFRLNRQFIVSIESIKNIHPYFNGALLVELIPPTEEKVIVSRYNAKEFKEWVDK
jgi:DNA-binding LytR/AlgR family response regulator